MKRTWVCFLYPPLLKYSFCHQKYLTLIIDSGHLKVKQRMHPCSSLTCCLSLDYLNLELLLHYQLDPVCAFFFALLCACLRLVIWSMKVRSYAHWASLVQTQLMMGSIRTLQEKVHLIKYFPYLTLWNCLFPVNLEEKPKLLAGCKLQVSTFQIFLFHYDRVV